MANSPNRPWEVLEDSRRLKRILRLCREKVHEVERMLFSRHVDIFDERRHLQPGAPERKYWSAGYLQALKDIMSLMDTGEFPCPVRFDVDGGPRLRVNGSRQS
jgi:hypothetical protein